MPIKLRAPGDMKLRIRGNSIRLRLTRGEVVRLSDGESITELTRLAGKQEFRYSLRPSPDTKISATMTNNHLAISAPGSALTAWASNDAVKLDCKINSEGPDILVEKDFACLAPREGSDDEDTFPHPKSGTETC